MEEVSLEEFVVEDVGSDEEHEAVHDAQTDDSSISLNSPEEKRTEKFLRLSIEVNGVIYVLPPENVSNNEAAEVTRLVQSLGINVDLSVLLTFWGLTQLGPDLVHHQIENVPALVETTKSDVDQITQIVGLRIRLRHMVQYMV